MGFELRIFGLVGLGFMRFVGFSRIPNHGHPATNIPVPPRECLRRGRSAASYPGALGGTD